MSIKLKSITEPSWLVIGDTDDIRIGLLSEIRDRYVLMAKGEKKQFLSRKEVNKYFKEDVFENVVHSEPAESVKKDYFINGFPVDFDNPHEVILKGNTLPLYSKKASSEIYYSAGYFCLGFEKNWMPALSPKLSTLNRYEYRGPFKDEAEMKLNLARLRKLRNKENNGN